MHNDNDTNFIGPKSMTASDQLKDLWKPPHLKIKTIKQAGAELCQAQAKLC